MEDAAHAVWLLDSYVYAHAVQECNMAAAGGAAVPEGGYPHLTALLARAEQGASSIDEEFALGLQLVLEAIARRL